MVYLNLGTAGLQELPKYNPDSLLTGGSAIFCGFGLDRKLKIALRYYDVMPQTSLYFKRFNDQHQIWGCSLPFLGETQPVGGNPLVGSSCVHSAYDSDDLGSTSAGLSC